MKGLDILDWSSMGEPARQAALARPRLDGRPELASSVRQMIDLVRAQGDEGVRELSARFDGVRLESFAVTAAEFEAASKAVSPEVLGAMSEARSRLIAWHMAGAPAEFDLETAPGVRCGRVLRGIRRVGLYVPAGTAPLPSTALMLGVPASLAGCEDVVVCTPPRADGTADPTVLVAAVLCGITRVFKAGGAQAIAAMAFGTDSIPACDKIFGPGNAYVTEAKQQVSSVTDGPAIDMPAGPSEVLVIADEGASSAFVAADLLAQAEHGPDSQVVLVVTSRSLAGEVIRELEVQLQQLPRAEIARVSLEHARIILAASIDGALEISNRYAPEHLILALREPRAHLSRVRSAGSVFLGDHTPESLGDYCSGTNHVLPTCGAARAYSGISVASFQKSISVQSATRAGLAAIGPCAVTLARAESLEAHAQAVVRRLNA